MERKRHWQYGWVAALVTGAALGFPLSGAAKGDPVLHEHYEANASEDAQLQATTLDGTLPAALATHSGAVSLTDLQANSGSPAPYQNESSDYSQEYRADSDTRRPELVGYTDPFIPTIPPYKRAHAYDTVGSQFELLVAAPSLRTMPVGGTARLEDDQFFADLQVQLPRNVAVRIPSVGPATRVIVAQLKPQQDFALFKDGADNWFMQSASEGVVQLTLHLAIDRRTFGAEYPSVSWGALRPHLPTVPDEVRSAAHAVALEIGVNEQQGPAATLRQLVEYFRSFAPSDQPLGSAGGGETLYRELSLNKRGVCRHRAYAFMVTALGLGLPTRFVHNEAHAWVEVFDAELWHRIDLGGAAARAVLDLGDRPVHVEPRDPYPWPERSTSAHEMTARALRERPAGMGETAASTAQSGTAQQLPAQQDGVQEDLAAPAATVTVNTARVRVTRGERLDVMGRVSAAAALCDRVRVDLWLTRGANERHALGTVMTDELGRFSGGMVVPFNVPVGDYEVEAATPGRSPLCGPGRSQR